MVFEPKQYKNWRENEKLRELIRKSIKQIESELNGNSYFRSEILGDRGTRIATIAILRYEGVLELWFKTNRIYRINKEKFEELKREICKTKKVI